MREKEEEIMFRSIESERKNLYRILSNINVNEKFILKHLDWIDEATKMEKVKRRSFIQDKINSIEEKGGKTNYQDMYEMYGYVHDLWDIIIESQRLSESFIEKYIIKRNKDNWKIICEKQDLSEEFMRKYSNNLNWWAVAHFRKFSEEFYLDFYENISQYIKYEDIKMFQIHLKNLKNESLKLLLAMREGYNGEDV